MCVCVVSVFRANSQKEGIPKQCNEIALLEKMKYKKQRRNVEATFALFVFFPPVYMCPELASPICLSIPSAVCF